MKHIPSRYKLETIWGEAVCNHLFTQRASLQQGFFLTAVEIDLMPGEAYAKAFDGPMAEGRVSTMVYFRTFTAKPQTLYLPPVYQEFGAKMYEGFEYGHIFKSGNAELPENAVTRGDICVFADAGMARITFTELGNDFAACLNALEEKAQKGGAIVTQVFFPLTQPCTGVIADMLRQRGYFVGGCLPRWFDNDGFLMQKVEGRPNFDAMKIYSKRAKEIVELIKKDWHEVTTCL